MPSLLLAIALLIPAADLLAGEADVLSATATCDSHRVCHFSVTVRHDDEGWEHYADRWEVLSPGGEPLATRVLAHPHDNEQPFTRSLRNVSIPEGMASVRLRARDSVHGYGGRDYVVSLSF